MKPVLIDSDILIEVSRGRDAGILTRWDALGRSQTVLTCSPVTVAELWHEARPQEHKILEDLFAAIQCVPIDLEIGRRAGDYLKHSRRAIASNWETHSLLLRHRGALR